MAKILCDLGMGKQRAAGAAARVCAKFSGSPEELGLSERNGFSGNRSPGQDPEVAVKVDQLNKGARTFQMEGTARARHMASINRRGGGEEAEEMSGTGPPAGWRYFNLVNLGITLSLIPFSKWVWGGTGPKRNLQETWKTR